MGFVSTIGRKQLGPLAEVTASADGHLEVAVRNPNSAFGDVNVINISPRVQIDGMFGILDSDVETTIESGATVESSSSIFRLATSATLGSLGRLLSRRKVRYRPGQGLLARYACRFPAPASGSIARAGIFNKTDGFYVGFNESGVFGCSRRQAGEVEIQTFSIDAASSGAETIQFQLDGTTFSTSVTGGGTTAQDAAEIANRIVGNWLPWDVQNIGSDVVFTYNKAKKLTGSFSFTNATGGGTLSGTLVETSAGIDNNDDINFVALADFNKDNLSGQGGELNPTGILFRTASMNTWEWVIPWHGAGSPTLYYYNPSTRHFYPVHVYEYGNAEGSILPHQKYPIYQAGYEVENVSSSGSISLEGSAFLGAVQGAVLPFRSPLAADDTQTVTTSESHIITIKMSESFGAFPNFREAIIEYVGGSLESTSNRSGVLRLKRNATLQGDVQWAEVSGSAVIKTSGGVTGITNGQDLITIPISVNSPASRDLENLDIRLVAGETLTLAGELIGGSEDIAGSITWRED